MSEETPADASARADPSKDEAAEESVGDPRGKWANNQESLLSMTGLLVGLVNVWRFPYMCYRHGGIVFLIPYFLFMMFLGLPVFFLETALGQFTSQGAVTAWRKICPMFQGVGVASLVILIYRNIYYIVIMAWTIFYFIQSFKFPLPWSTCDNDWNTETCHSHMSVYANPHLYRENSSWSFLNNVSFEDYFYNTTDMSGFEPSLHSSEHEFWNHRVLRMSEHLSLGSLHWDLALCLLLAWVLCFFCVFKSIRFSGKVVYVTVTLPYLLMVVLFFRGVTLPGAGQGLMYYLVPDFSRLATFEVWEGAASYVIYSQSLSLGVLTTMGSYNKFKHNTYRDCMLLCGVNAATGIFAGLIVFSFIGFMAHDMGVAIEEVASSGPGLAFLAFPKVLSLLPAPRFWAMLFFLMIFLLTLNSQFLSVESMIATVTDLFPGQLRKAGVREILALVIAGICFLLGLPLVTQGGFILFHVIDQFGPSAPCVLLITGMETFIVAWVYGADRFLDNIKDMMGVTPYPVMKYCWLFITPFLCAVMLQFELANNYPWYIYEYAPGPGIRALCALILATPMVMIPIFLLGSLRKNSDNMTTPDGDLRQAWPHKPRLTLCKRVVIGSTAPPPTVEMSEKERMDRLGVV